MKLAQTPPPTNADSFIDTQTAIIQPSRGRKEGKEGGKRGEKRKERGFSLDGIYIYIYEAFSCSREPDTGREGIKQTGRQDADRGRVGLNACGCLNRTQPRCSAISRVPVAPEMLPNSLHLRPALYSPGNALSPFLKVQEAARTAFPSLSGPCNSLSLSLSLVRIFCLFHFYFLSRPRYHATSNFLRWWRVKEGKGLSPFRHGIGIVARMHSHNDDGRGTRLERETFTLLLSFALTPIALDFHLEEAGCAEGSYEEITSGCTVTKRLFVFFFFGISSLVLPMNLE